MGAPPAFRAHVEATRQSREFPVLPENAASLDVFLRMATQWVVAPMGGALGMNYASLRWIMEITVPADRHVRTLEDVQMMERAALEVINARGDA